MQNRKRDAELDANGTAIGTQIQGLRMLLGLVLAATVLGIYAIVGMLRRPGSSPTSSDSQDSEPKVNKLAIGKKQRQVGLAVGLTLAAFIAGAGYLLWALAPLSLTAATEKTADVLVWALLGGLLGGAGRALRALVYQWGGKAEHGPATYYDKWFVYLIKVPMGVVGGLSFVLLVNLGLVQVFAGESQTQFGFLQVMLGSISGGLFFEDVFGKLQSFVANGPG